MNFPSIFMPLLHGYGLKVAILTKAPTLQFRKFVKKIADHMRKSL